MYKVFRLHAEECEILQAVFPMREEVGHFSQDAKFFHECLSQFHGSDFARFSFSGDSMLLQSTLEDGPAQGMSALHSGMWCYFHGLVGAAEQS